MEITRECVWCGSSFGVARTTTRNKYCSSVCRKASAQAAFVARKFAERPTKCAECGVDFQQNPVGRPRRFCSDACKIRTANRRQRRTWLPLMQPAERPCAHCGTVFLAKSRDRIYCYDKWCAQAAYYARKGSSAQRLVKEHDVTCDGCGTKFVGKHPSARWCSKACANRHWGAVRARQRRASSTANYTDLQVFQRDAWRCHICGEQVDWTLPRTHPDGATIDHLVPISRGGVDELANVATAHWRCNLAKGVT